MAFPFLSMRNPAPVRRLYPENQGAPLGDVSVWATMPAAAPGLVVNCPDPTRAVMLDPEWTTPGAVIAVMPKGGDRGDAQFLRPGDVAVFDRPVTRFHAWNPMRAIDALWGTSPTGGLAQQLRVAFLAAQAPEQLVERPRIKPRPRVAVLRSGGFSPDEVQPGVGTPVEPLSPIYAAGLEGLRISVLPIGAAGTLIEPTPVDFAATIRPWVIAQGGKKTVGTLKFYLFSVLESLDAGFAYNPGGGAKPTAKWLPNAEGDLAATPSQLTFDREAPVGALGFGFTVEALEGAGVTNLWLIVEGY